MSHADIYWMIEHLSDGKELESPRWQTLLPIVLLSPMEMNISKEEIHCHSILLHHQLCFLSFI